MNRRRFLQRIILAPAALAFARRAGAAGSGPYRFGMITDVHQDVMHDGVARMQAFVRAMAEAKPGFIIQLGDFCQPKPVNQPFLDAWNAFGGPRYHVIGNHDMDGGFKREQTVAFNGMPARYYRFDAGPFVGVVLDGNDPGGKAGGYKRYVAADQRAWLEKTLGAAEKPVIVFIHQPMEEVGGLENAAEVRAILNRACAAKPGLVLATICGHLHQDYLHTIDGLPYLQLNSASYVWLPGNAAREVYPKEQHAAHPSLRNVAPYRDPLWALATLDLARGELLVEGRASEWVGPDPWARGAGEKDYPRDVVRPAISPRTVPVTRV